MLELLPARGFRQCDALNQRRDWTAWSQPVFPSKSQFVRCYPRAAESVSHGIAWQSGEGPESEQTKALEQVWQVPESSDCLQCIYR
jgi:hypothetical protein